MGAALWAFHPVNVESVAWIAETKNTLSGLFYLLTIWFFIKGLKIDGTRRRKDANTTYVLTLVFFGVGAGGKIVDRDPTAGALSVRVVDGRAVALAQRGQGGADFPALARCWSCLDVDAKSYRWP